jgi:hypothetical protein
MRLPLKCRRLFAVAITSAKFTSPASERGRAYSRPVILPCEFSKSRCAKVASPTA